jgi:hypothetical protein
MTTMACFGWGLYGIFRRSSKWSVVFRIWVGIIRLLLLLVRRDSLEGAGAEGANRFVQ